MRAASAIAGVFLGKDQPFVRVSRADAAAQLITTRAPATVVGHDAKVVVVVDALSASASEMLVSAITESHRGVSVGTTTRGKGVVQGAFGLSRSGGSALIVTTARLHAQRSGDSWHQKGLRPDISLPWLPPSSLPLPVFLLPLDSLPSPADSPPATAATEGFRESGVKQGAEPWRENARFRCPTFWACGWDAL